MYNNERLFWWCNKCQSNVDVLQAPGVGLFCIVCGLKTSVPKNIPEPLFLDLEEEEWKDLPHEDEDENTIV